MDDCGLLVAFSCYKCKMYCDSGDIGIHVNVTPSTVVFMGYCKESSNLFQVL
jgi:hypothetical protein